MQRKNRSGSDDGCESPNDNRPKKRVKPADNHKKTPKRKCIYYYLDGTGRVSDDLQINCEIQNKKKHRYVEIAGKKVTVVMSSQFCKEKLVYADGKPLAQEDYAKVIKKNMGRNDCFLHYITDEKNVKHPVFKNSVYNAQKKLAMFLASGELVPPSKISSFELEYEYYPGRIKLRYCRYIIIEGEHQPVQVFKTVEDAQKNNSNSTHHPNPSSLDSILTMLQKPGLSLKTQSDKQTTSSEHEDGEEEEESQLTAQSHSATTNSTLAKLSIFAPYRTANRQAFFDDESAAQRKKTREYYFVHGERKVPEQYLSTLICEKQEDGERWYVEIKEKRIEVKTKARFFQDKLVYANGKAVEPNDYANLREISVGGTDEFIRYIIKDGIKTPVFTKKVHNEQNNYPMHSRDGRTTFLSDNLLYLEYYYSPETRLTYRRYLPIDHKFIQVFTPDQMEQKLDSSDYYSPEPDPTSFNRILSELPKSTIPPVVPHQQRRFIAAQSDIFVTGNKKETTLGVSMIPALPTIDRFPTLFNTNKSPTQVSKLVIDPIHFCSAGQDAFTPASYDEKDNLLSEIRTMSRAKPLIDLVEQAQVIRAKTKI